MPEAMTAFCVLSSAACWFAAFVVFCESGGRRAKLVRAAALWCLSGLLAYATRWW